jgi:flavin-dependent dehydrogenase
MILINRRSNSILLSMECSHDVVVIGGAIAGAATAFLLKRKNPLLRILIVEKAEEFDRKVGESTSEVGACFLMRVLNLSNHLGHEQITKSGLRMWFFRDSNDGYTRCGEIGPKHQTRLPAFQLDRAKLDEEVLQKAVKAGCELWRPAKVQDLELGGVEKNEINVRIGEETRKVTTRWVVDASGWTAVIPRKLKIYRPLETHPINAVWARFRNVTDLDGPEIWESAPDFTEPCWAMRQWATNHLMGNGWWGWLIPLRGGDCSVGLVYDSRIFQLPPGPHLGERLKSHLMSHPLGEKALCNAQYIEKDVHARSNLAYYSERSIGDGWALVGDSSGFLDPLYSQGFDFISYTCFGVFEILSDALAGKEITKARDRYNCLFQKQFHTWFESIYKDKYYYIGDLELMTVAFYLDIGAYFIGPVRQAYSNDPHRYSELPYGGPIGQMFGRLMRLYNRRLAAIAKRKIAIGTFGLKNLDKRLFLPGFSPGPGSLRFMLRGLRKWLVLECKNLAVRGPSDSPPGMRQVESVPHQ